MPENKWTVLETNQRPPFEKNCAILAAHSRNGIVLASLRVAGKLETWALDVAKKTWKHLDVKFDPHNKYEGMAGTRNRVLLYLPDRNLFVMEIRTKKEQQIWTIRYADASALLPKPRQIVRLNAKPIDQLAYRDPDAGKGTRRYEIVAVDRLGPEGIPSQPVWSRREWQRFYEPYTDDWHQ